MACSDNRMEKCKRMAEDAREASDELKRLSAEDRTATLQLLVESLSARKGEIMGANVVDVREGLKCLGDGHMSDSMLSRLKFSERGWESNVKGLNDLVGCDDVIGECVWHSKMVEGMDCYRISCAIGVILVIYESRPDVCMQIVGLAIRSGNAVILKPGKESYNTTLALVRVISSLTKPHGPNNIPYPEKAIQFVFDRDEVECMLGLDHSIDLVIPRGSNKLVSHIKKNTSIHVLGHADGRCFIYADKSLNLTQAMDIIVDAKTDYPAACNALDGLLVHESVWEDVCAVLDVKCRENSIQVHYDADCRNVGKNLPSCEKFPLTEDDRWVEWLGPHLTVLMVSEMQQAISYINKYGSHHTDCILTTDQAQADIFTRAVSSACVFVNMSTRWSDGYRFGLGAEVGISTNKIHARGPVGISGLTIYKYIGIGHGHTIANTEKNNNKRGISPYIHQIDQPRLSHTPSMQI